MKNKIILKYLVFTILCSTLSSHVIAQATSAGGGNVPGSLNDYIGWTFGTQGSGSLTFDQLTIKNEDPMPINFYTNAGTGGYANQSMTIFDGVAASNAGYVGIGIVSPPRHLTITTLGASLVGTTPIMTELLVAGGIRNDNTGRQTVADFQSANDNSNSIGIRIRGSRNSNQNSDCAYIDFQNYYLDGNCDFPLARMSADVRNFGCTDDASGYYRLKIADGTASGGYNLAMFADHNGQVGIGLNFAYTEPPNTRLEVWDVNTAIAQFRITQDYALDIFSDFTTYSTGDLLINPTNAGAFQKVGIDLTTSDLPTEVLDVNGNGRFRNVEPTLTPVTDDFLIWGERDAATAFGTLHRLPFSGANSDILHGDGTWGPEGAGTVTACGGIGGTTNYITKFTSSTDICKTSIWENDASTYGNTNVGVHTAAPKYNFHNYGSSIFERNGISAACSTYNSLVYPLSVISFNGGATGPAGLGIFSTGSSSTANDELNLYADANGLVNFRFLSGDVNFHSIISSKSYLGFDAADQTVIMKNDFASSPTAPVGAYTKLFVEAQDGSSPDHDYAIWAKNTVSVYSSGYVACAIRADAIEPNATAYADITRTIISNAKKAQEENTAILTDAGDISTVTTSGSTNYGGRFYGRYGLTNFGIYSESYGEQGINSGGSFLANGTTTNYGVKGDANGGTINYGVYGIAPTGGCPGGGGGCSDAAAYFNGDAFCSTGTLFITSDSTYKKNIAPMQNASQLLKQVNAYSYVFDTSKTHGLNVGQGLQYGLLSQEVNTVLPGLVKEFINPEQTDSLGNVINPQLNVLGLNLLGMIPVLLGGYKEQQVLIDTLYSQLSAMQAIVNNCCNISPRSTGSNQEVGNRQTVELKNIKTIFLDQNKPNPFAEQTDIDYYLPSEVKNAEMVFSDDQGHKIQTVPLNERGKGTLHIYSPELKSGSYRYSLIADGKVIETKTMVNMK